MGIHVLKRVSELGDAFVLAPERFDPRRSVQVESRRCLSDVADIVTENVTAEAPSSARSILVLDTTHAYEGFVVLRHAPVAPGELVRAKRRIEAGDVIVSRLRPYLRQVAYIDAALFNLVPGGNGVAASTEFFVVRGRGTFDAAALVPFLLSEAVQVALAAGQEGGHHPRFSKELLGSLRIPDGVITSATALARKVRRLAGGIRGSLGGCRELVLSVERQMQEHSRAVRARTRAAPSPPVKPARRRGGARRQ